ncbi:thiol reductant ABC exporter subunit CydD [Brevibacterium litoralis]|uniref:thiol reductant ABC exporter subunit CydD n=1 Tax=Brevibacterium litoralis TaxID=3138935 RepID=UPI0032EE21D3
MPRTPSTRSPVAIALASIAGRRALALLTGIAALKALGLVLVADGLSRGVADLFVGTWDSGSHLAVATAVLGGVLRALVAWATRSVGARAAVTVREETRRALASRILSGSTRDIGVPEGALGLLGTRSLDDFDDYFTQVLPALTATLVVPFVLIARILFADWVSAVVLCLTLPLVPFFMVLIGGYTAERVQEATAALDRLSTHLVELARGLPVLVGLGRVRAQTAALGRITAAYRDTTLTTLRVAFLSALALELLATISVALVAVFIGVRLVHGGMELRDGLFALVLAPECFLPLRRLGAAFHSTENGLAAFRRVQEVIGTPLAARVPAPRSPDEGGDAAEALRIDGLTVTHAGRDVPALVEVDARIPERGLTVLTGASGAGKSTLLGVLAGFVRAEGGTRVTGSVIGGSGEESARAWVPQAPRTHAATLDAELRLYAGECSADDRQRALRAVGLDLSPETSCAALSPGELRRLALARALVRVWAGARLVLADEPTAHLDPDAAERVRAVLRELTDSATVVVATHDPALVARADQVMHLADGRMVPDAPARGTGATGPDGDGTGEERGQGASADGSARWTGRERLLDGSTPDGPAPDGAGAGAIGVRRALGRLARAVDMRRPRFWLAVLCGIVAVAAGAALTAVSAWLIVHAATQPPIMYLLVAIVGVRFFGLSRSVFTYWERLSLHHAMLDALVDLRVRIWGAFARTGTADRHLQRGEAALTRLVSDVDDVRDLAPRVVLPPVVAVVVSVAAVVTLSLVHPWAGLVLALGSVLALGGVPPLTLLLDARATRVRTEVRRAVLARFAALLHAREDLVGNGRGEAAVADLATLDSRAGRAERRAVRATGTGEALLTGTGIVTGALMLPVLAPAVLAGSLDPALLAVTVLLPLALLDTWADALAALQQWPTLRAVLARVPELDAPGDGETGPGAGASEQGGAENAPGARDGRDDLPGVRPVPDPRLVELDGVAARWPGTLALVFSGVDARMRPGEWTVVTGPSGSGKTTLVSVVLRFLAPVAGDYRLDGRSVLDRGPEALVGRVAWCPQESHVFDSGLRGNLLIARDREDAPDEAEMEEVLRRVGLGDLVEQIGLDARIGAGGSHLSGGQRQRLAVARTLLARSRVVVLDEPTAHLDPPLAAALMDDLRAGLDDRMVLLVTHRTGEARPGDGHVDLAAHVPGTDAGDEVGVPARAI